MPHHLEAFPLQTKCQDGRYQLSAIPYCSSLWERAQDNPPHLHCPPRGVRMLLEKVSDKHTSGRKYVTRYERIDKYQTLFPEQCFLACQTFSGIMLVSRHGVAENTISALDWLLSSITYAHRHKRPRKTRLSGKSFGMRSF